MTISCAGPAIPVTGTAIWAQHDAQPGDETYATPAWAPGEIVIDAYVIRVPADAPPGTYSLSAGFYDLPTLERLPVLEPDGRVAGDHVILTEIEVME